MSHKASQAVAQTSACKLARFYSDTTRWAHVGALWVKKGTVPFPSCFSQPAPFPLPEGSGRAQHSKECACKAPLQEQPLIK